MLSEFQLLAYTLYLRYARNSSSYGILGKLAKFLDLFTKVIYADGSSSKLFCTNNCWLSLVIWHNRMFFINIFLRNIFSKQLRCVILKYKISFHLNDICYVNILYFNFSEKSTFNKIWRL